MEVVEEALQGRPPRRNSQTTIAQISTKTTTNEVHQYQVGGDSLESSNGAEGPFILQEHADDKEVEKNEGSEYTTNGLSDSNSPASPGNTIFETEPSPTVPSLPPSKQEQTVAAASSSDKSATGHKNNRLVIEESSRQPVVTEFYLKEVYQKPVTQEFYCPNCNTRIQKVLLLSTDGSDDCFRCDSCFSFLIAARNVFCPPKGDADSPRGKAGEPHPGSANFSDVEKGTPPSPEPRPRNKWDILKSIVYGGLNESIASLSIVTSAASSGATTLNILALALANLIGGLFIISHNLWDLISEEPRVASSEIDGQAGSSSRQTTEQVDRYQELLGRRQNFKLHAIVALLSFLVFGLVPPVVYAFTFRESNDKDYKLAAVAGASLLCVALLAIGKAHVQTQPKYIKTVTGQVVMAVAASGLSYVAGELIEKLIDDLGWFKSGAALSIADASSAKPLWASY